MGSKKVAYVVFTGRKTGVFTEWFVDNYTLFISFQQVRSSAETQVKYFPGCSFKGYTNVEEAITAWDKAVANNIVGVPKSRSNRLVPPTTTPSHQGVPSTPSRKVLRTPICAKSSTSTPSAQGSETRLAAIIAALNDVDLSHLTTNSSHYVVVRGEKPGVYSNRYVALLSLTFYLTS